MPITRLREIAHVKQTSAQLRRRWWTSPSMDLYVWQEPNARIAAFELCYDKPHDEHSLRWDAAHGYRHSRIDDGEATAFDQQTPMAVADGHYRLEDIALRFESAAAEVEPVVFRTVLGVLQP
jgi:hypothetical protein